jgi:anti-sigma factor RsiW
MPACVDQELLIGGLVDGELDAANVAMVEAHVARCEGCREELERLEALRMLTRGNGVRHLAPDRLRERILTLPELAPKAANSNSRLPSWLAPGVAGALAASLAMVAFVNPVQEQSALDEQLISSHVRSLQPGHLTDVQTTNQHIVKPWFNGKIDFAPPVPELADRGFPLAGGRLDSVGGKTVAAIVYHRRLHTVNLFVWRGRAGATKVAVEDGFSLVEWNEDGLNFAAVSDIPAEELRLFRDLYRSRSALVPTDAN